MQIGVPKEVRPFEGRVGLAPAGVQALASDGHDVLVETGAGVLSGFMDDDYRTAGARICFQSAEVWQRSELVARVGPVVLDEVQRIRAGQLVVGFHFTQSAPRPILDAFAQHKACLLGYEQLADEHGERRVQNRMSEIAGRLSVVVAAQLLQNSRGGIGILMGGVPGVGPAEVLILGGGVMGENACRAALGLGARVTVIDPDVQRLSYLERTIAGPGRPVLLAMTHRNLERSVGYANVIIAAVRAADGRLPRLLTRADLRRMRPGAILIDGCIDRGGIAETSRPTSLGEPTYTVDGVQHYCVANMPADVARTATHALTHAALPVLRAIARDGIDEGVRRHPYAASGIQMWKGDLVVPAMSAEDLPVHSLAEVLER